MKTILFLSLLLPMMAAAADPKPAKAEEDLSYIYVLMKDTDRPKLEYEGEGIQRNSTFEQPDRKVALYKFELIAMKLGEGETFILDGLNDKPEKYIVQFTGTLERTGKDQIQVKGAIESKIAGVVQFVEMARDKQELSKDFPEIPFKKGTTKIEFNGKVLGWFDK